MVRPVKTDAGVTALRPRLKPYLQAVANVPGLFVRVMPSGHKSFVAVARAPGGKQVWHTIDNAALALSDAEDEAREVIRKIKRGEDRKPPQSFEDVANDWFKRRAEERKLITGDRIRLYLDRDILPAWGDREFTSIKRGEVTALLDKVEDKAGPVAADYVLNVIRLIMKWQSARSDDYVSPIVAGMRRSNPKERQRDRVLSDKELRAVWLQAESNGTFGAVLQMLLLTAQRFAKVAEMRWDDIRDGTWYMPKEEREKGVGGDLTLPKAALAILKAQPRQNAYVFAGRSGHFSGFSKAKRTFDDKVKIEPWRLHDLRRTSRSLMSRARIQPHVAELVLGHSLKGVWGTYDQHSYMKEKGEALATLATLIENIVRPRKNVVNIAG